MRKYRNNIISIVGVLLCSLAVVLVSQTIFAGGFVEDRYGKGLEYYKGEVVEVVSEELTPDAFIDGIFVGFQNVVVSINEGPLANEEFEIRNPISRTYDFRVSEGTNVILGVYYQNEQPIVQIYNYDRSQILYVLMALFVVAVVLIGGIKGVKSLVALLFTLVCTLYLMIPLMLRGVNPIGAAVLVAVLSASVTLLLVSGWNKKSVSAIIGTIAGVCIAGVIAYVFGNLAYLSGAKMDNAESLMYIAEDSGLKIHGLMFAGILIASLGAVMDVAMSIASAIFEVYHHNDTLTTKKLFGSGMNIGKDIIGTMTNTLILAFAGGSISMLIMIFSAQMPYNKLINLDLLGIEVIQGLSGSIGIVLAVPITAIIASILVTRKK